MRNVIKIALIGSENVGKSCLCSSIVCRQFEKNYIPTIGVDYIVKHIVRKNDSIRLSLWDLSGSDRFSSIVNLYVEKSSVLVYCYSSESYSTFIKMVSKYYEHHNRGYTTNKHIIIVETKTDSEKTTKNFEIIGKKFADKHANNFIKTSSYTKEGIQDLINMCVKIIPKVKVKSYCVVN
jgi:small GTP-binding protein